MYLERNTTVQDIRQTTKEFYYLSVYFLQTEVSLLVYSEKKFPSFILLQAGLDEARFCKIADV